MYFESNRSSDDGMLAVGTVVMNRLDDPRYPKTVCGVAGQPGQFAAGAMTNPVMRRSESWARATRIAEAVLDGQRHRKVGEAKFFHTAGYTFPYRNMHYVAFAGGNVFYEKKTPGTFQPVNPATLSAPTMLASAERSLAVERIAAERPTPIERPSTAHPMAVAERAKAAPLALRPTILASAEPSPKLGAIVPGRKPAPLPQAFKPQPTKVASAQPPAKPKPIVLAMLADKNAPLPPARSIGALIERDSKRR
jgi:hypothetical protein